MTLLTVVQRVCAEVGLPQPSVVATSQDTLVRQLFNLANAELEELSKSKNWPVLQREHTFDTIAAQVTYTGNTYIPAAFRKLIVGAAWNADQYYRVRGSLTPQQWQQERNVSLNTLSRFQIRIGGSPRSIRIVPTPTDAQTIVYEYMTSMYAADSLAAEKAIFTADTDVALVDEALVRAGLKWRIKHAKGLDYAEDRDQYERMVARDYAAALALDIQPVARRNLINTPELDPGYMPENGFGA